MEQAGRRTPWYYLQNAIDVDSRGILQTCADEYMNR